MIEAVKDWLQIGIGIFTVIGLTLTIIAQVRVMINVRKIEVATNSMKDALVAATEKSAGLEGEKRGRASEIARQAKVD